MATIMNDCMYKQFFKEMRNCEFLEKDEGFATYSCLDNYFYIEDVYVLPEYRKQGICKQFDKELCKIAKELGYDSVLGSINLNMEIENIRRSEKMLISLGYDLYKKKPSIFFYKKEVK